jgi:hypothetical protein
MQDRKFENIRYTNKLKFLCTILPTIIIISSSISSSSSSKESESKATP